jgi:signal transduction histidine kinase
MEFPLRRYLDPALVVAGVLAMAALLWPLTSARHPLLAIPVALLTCLPWLWRERYPIGTLLCSAAGVVLAVIVLRTYDWASAAAIVLLFFVALDGDRRRSLIVGAAAVLVLGGMVAVLIPAIERSDEISAALARVLAVLAALVVGDLARSRAALRAAQREQISRDLRDARERADRQVAAERLQIARELHDTLAHALVAINVRAGVTTHLGVSPGAAEALTEIKDVSARALTDLRTTLDVLRENDLPAPRDPALGLDAVPRLLEPARAAGLETEVEVSLNGASVPSVVDHAAFRIVQESLTNVIRHARARRAVVRVAAEAGILTIDVTDDGAAAPRRGDGGHGLVGMSERVAAVGGTLTAGPRPERGWRVHAAIPLGHGVR